MKEIYKKIIIGVVSFVLFFFVDKDIFSDISSLYFFGVIVVIPIILFKNKILNSWIVLYILYILSNIYIKIVPPTSNSSCWSFCGGDWRDLNYLMVYVSSILILGLLQLRHFVQRKMAEKEIKSQNK